MSRLHALVIYAAIAYALAGLAYVHVEVRPRFQAPADSLSVQDACRVQGCPRQVAPVAFADARPGRGSAAR